MALTTTANRAVKDRFGHHGVTVAIAVFAFSMPSCAPSLKVLRHSETDAARVAQEFADAAFVARDFKRAYELTTPALQSTMSPEQFHTTITKLHPQTFPATVTAIEFEPMPGQPAMNIFLHGESPSEKFYYRLMMEGTKDAGYKVGGFFRGNGPHPPSKLRRPLSK